MSNAVNLIIFCFLLTNVFGNQSNVKRQSNIQRQVINGIYNTSHILTINKNMEYIIEYTGDTGKYPVRITVSSPSSTEEQPLLIVAQQQKHITSWQLPYIANPLKEAVEYPVAGHILCPESSSLYKTMSTWEITPRVLRSNGASSPVVTVTVKSPGAQDHTFTIIAKLQTDFFLQNNKVYSSVVTASQPIYYFYNFRDSGNEAKGSGAVLVRAASDSWNCMIISIQNSYCPVFDLENNIKFNSYWHTMNLKTGIVVPKKKYPDGFYIVMVVIQDDSVCSEDPIMTTNKTKIVNITVINTITHQEHLIAAMSTIAIFVGILLICTIVGMGYLIRSKRRDRHEATVQRTNAGVRDKNKATVHIIDAGVSLSNGQESTKKKKKKVNFPIIQKDEDEATVDRTDAGVSLTNGHESNRWVQYFRASSVSKKTPDEAPVVTIVAPVSQPNRRRTIRLRQSLREPTLAKPSAHYVWHVGIVALFYSIPVLQLVLTLQGIVHVTGNQDLCYYNFLCAHPLGNINDFNHVFSNIGYIFLGLLFIIIAYVKELTERGTSSNMYGLPRPYGMYYALGFALMMEGVMSACYHICPKESNYQFDTCFMYVIGVLMVVNIYENRHSTGDKRGYAIFGFLAIAATLSTLSLLIGETLYFWIIIGIIQITSGLALTWVLDNNLFKFLWTAEGRQKLTRQHICGIILWIIGNVMNWSLVYYGINSRSGFATYLLIVLIINGLFYMIYYIAMKICYKERILRITWVFIVLANIFWAVAMYFFVANVTSWNKLPAESRNLNQECVLVDYYDSHDIWHFLSSIALFFSFMVLLTLDEGLSRTRRADIIDFHTH